MEEMEWGKASALDERSLPFLFLPFPPSSFPLYPSTFSASRPATSSSIGPRRTGFER